MLRPHNPFLITEVEVDEHERYCHVQKLQEAYQSHGKESFRSDVSELHPHGAVLDQVLDYPIDESDGCSVHRNDVIVVSQINQIVWTPVLVLLLPSKCQLQNVQSLAKAISDELDFLLRLYVFLFGVQVLLWTIC